MDPRRVLLFRTVARTGSLSAAARALTMTQPAVSQQLRHLEREAGCPLLLRSPRGVTLTEAGELLLARADAVASQLHMADEELSSVANLRGGRVRLVAFPSAAAVLVPDALQELRSRHPGLEVTMVEAEPPEAWTAVREGEADVALAFGYDGPPPDDGELVWVPLAVEPLFLVLPPDHPHTAARSTGWLADEPWIAGCERCRQHLVERCREEGFEPLLTHESDDYVVVQNLVARGLGVTVLPRLALQAFRHPEVVVRPLDSFGERHVGIAHRPGAGEVPATRALVERLVASADSLPPGLKGMLAP
jgi:DNA-binding transcriptional LysR family regulator